MNNTPMLSNFITALAGLIENPKLIRKIKYDYKSKNIPILRGNNENEIITVIADQSNCPTICYTSTTTLPSITVTEEFSTYYTTYNTESECYTHTYTSTSQIDYYVTKYITEDVTETTTLYTTSLLNTCETCLVPNCTVSILVTPYYTTSTTYDITSFSTDSSYYAITETVFEASTNSIDYESYVTATSTYVQNEIVVETVCILTTQSMNILDLLNAFHSNSQDDLVSIQFDQMEQMLELQKNQGYDLILCRIETMQPLFEYQYKSLEEYYNGEVAAILNDTFFKYQEARFSRFQIAQQLYFTDYIEKLEDTEDFKKMTAEEQQFFLTEINGMLNRTFADYQQEQRYDFNDLVNGISEL